LNHASISKTKDFKSNKSQSIITCKEASIRLSADFSSGTLQAMRGWNNIFKVPKGNEKKTNS
jgi:hypothetical protein